MPRFLSLSFVRAYAMCPKYGLYIVEGYSDHLSSPTTAHPKTLFAGTKLGRYEIISKIVEGGKGEVYLATDTELDRIVAVKILAEGLTAHEQRLLPVYPRDQGCFVAQSSAHSDDS